MAALDRFAGERLYLDTNIFVYWLEGYAVFAAVLTDLFARLKRGELHSVTSELTLAECLVKPMIDGNRTRQGEYHAAISRSPELSVVPVSRAVLIEAAAIRAETRAPLADAIHLATARLSDCTAFVTNDERLRGPADITIVTLGELARA